MMDDESTNGVEFVIAEIGAKILVEFLDRRERLERVFAVAFTKDVFLVAKIVFVLDLADDLLQ